MSNMAKVRSLLVSIQAIAGHLTDEEISDIGIVLLKAIERLEREEEEV